MLLERFWRVEVFCRRNFFRGDVPQKRARGGVLPSGRVSGRGRIGFPVRSEKIVFFLPHTFVTWSQHKGLKQSTSCHLCAKPRLVPVECRASRNKQELSSDAGSCKAAHPPVAGQTGQHRSLPVRGEATSYPRHFGEPSASQCEEV